MYIYSISTYQFHTYDFVWSLSLSLVVRVLYIYTCPYRTATTRISISRRLDNSRIFCDLRQKLLSFIIISNIKYCLFIEDHHPTCI